MKKSKKIAKKESSTNLQATSKGLLGVKISDRLLQQIKAFDKEKRKALGAAIQQVEQAWGRPHMHSGIGIRRLRNNVFECRCGLDLRLVFLFIARPPELIFFVIGNHDDIQNLLRDVC